ncbi:MAG TPA: extensin family protein, partial [Pseudolabrys sp.]|nr:extensin family protein [Pseudolabrys sp.]
MRLSLGGLTLLIALAGCGRSMWQYGERASWRHEAEVSCLKSGAVKIGGGVVQIQPIEGPGVCGADFPLKVSALGEGGGVPMAYGDDLRPPAGIPNGSSANMPRWPASQPAYQPPPPPQPISAPSGGRMQWSVGPQGIEQGGAAAQPAYQQQPAYPQQQAYPQQPAYRQPTYEPPAPAGGPMSIRPPDAEEADDIPDDAVLPGDPSAPAISRPKSQPPMQPASQPPPALGPQRAPAAAAMQAALTPPATLACPIVSALDRWVSEGVQPAALRWFGQPVVTMKQISAYSCRDMVGNSSVHISEHAFGNALDIAAFTLADGRTVSVQHGWHGAPEEQGFLHDVQLSACQMFTTVLAPGYNAAHYNHIHVDLMRRASGRTP